MTTLTTRLLTISSEWVGKKRFPQKVFFHPFFVPLLERSNWICEDSMSSEFYWRLVYTNYPNLSDNKYGTPCKLKIYLDCSSQLGDVLGRWIVCSYRSRTLIPAGNHCQCHNLLVQLHIDYWRCSKSSRWGPACYSL